ncbi:hypothetical protein [Marinivivus vitaminiproducens]|uniref:hypothetical protein n=1 Tax=Marinivivus vitaminiproducens TaxID=3035935 RepID=UPI00279E2F8B|nr:hypothetical protein P4R82_12935 [Geminicoccaceae bacterium SCSIO 64248]
MMVNTLDLASDVTTSGVALAGLILVYLGAVASGFDSYDKSQQNSVRLQFQVRAWVAFAGVMISVLSALLAFIGKWISNECMVASASIVLIFAFVWSVISALLTAWSIR